MNSDPYSHLSAPLPVELIPVIEALTLKLQDACQSAIAVLISEQAINSKDPKVPWGVAIERSRSIFEWGVKIRIWFEPMEPTPPGHTLYKLEGLCRWESLSSLSPQNCVIETGVQNTAAKKIKFLSAQEWSPYFTIFNKPKMPIVDLIAIDDWQKIQDNLTFSGSYSDLRKELRVEFLKRLNKQN